MRYTEVNDRNENLIAELAGVWRESVIKSHDFLSRKDIDGLAEYVPAALAEIQTLLVVFDETGKAAGFAGIDGHKLEMLFLHPLYFHQGIGRKLVEMSVEKYHVSEVDVNEQNPQAKLFYEHMGFRTYARDAFDAQGNHFPILHMRLK